MTLVKSLYVIAIGLLVVAFVGFGADAFYQPPKEPEFPTDLQYKLDETRTSEEINKQKQYDKDQKAFQEKISDYNQNLSVLLIGLAVFILGVSILGLSKLELIGDGTTLGGVFTLFYGIIRAISTEEAIFRFVAVTVALLVVLVLTYWKFLREKFPLTK